MPTVFTHALVGGALTQIAPGESPRWKILLVFVAVAVVPDLDVIAFSLDIPYAHPLGHRGFAHSLVFAGTFSFLVCLALFSKPARFTKGWWWLVAITFFAAATHDLLDAATDAGLGIGLFIPFSPRRIFFAFRPIRTTTVNPFTFFQQRSLAILWSEIVWVWLPVLSLSVMYQMGRYLHYLGRKRAFTQRP